MKKRVGVLFLILATAVALVLLLNSGGFSHRPSLDDDLKESGESGSETKPTESFVEIADRPFLERDVPVREDSPVCEKLENAMLREGVAELLRQLRDGFIDLPEECLTAQSQNPYLALIGRDCQKTQRGLKDQVQCETWIRVYRAFLIDRITSSESDLSKLSFQVLVNKLIWKQTRDGGVSLEEQIRILDEMERLRPDHPSLYKLKSMLFLFGGPDYGKMQKVIEEGLRKSPRDRELQDLWYYAEAKKAELDSRYQSRNSDHSFARYYRAGLLWKAGQKAEARKLVEALAREYPQDDRYSRTLLSMDRREENPFYLRLRMEEGRW